MTPLSPDRTARFCVADQAVAVGIWINAGLMVMKLLAGCFGRSEAVFADGLESACDLAAMLSTMIALKIGRKPFDQKHPYGHGKAESIAAIMVSLVILATGGGILYRSIMTIMEGSSVEPRLIAVLAALATIVVKETLYRYTRSVAGRLESPAVDAVAKDHRKDALTSVATLIGVGGAFFGATLMDPLAAVLTAIFIFYIGGKILLGATHDLMDGQPPRDWIVAVGTMAERVPGIDHVHEIRCRRSGQYLIIDLKLDMDPAMTVKESHAVSVAVKRTLFEHFPNVGDVMIHINPHEEAHEDLIRL
ncbi:MAG: cation diffusion facilitator family transporter [Deltaproteobacteria bacterium]|nr:cation diffusion facilitator family transporter [Deltaproteobacteria bacterium]